MTGARVDHTGEQYGKLTITSVAGKVKNSRRIYWNAVCECGNEKIVDVTQLKDGTIKSCGCYRREIGKTRGKRLPDGEANLNLRYRGYEKGAKERNYSFELTKEEFKDITSKPCRYCNTTKNIGIDRVDNTQGYILENCAPCCKRCNRAKDTMGVDEFLDWIHRVANNNPRE